MNNKTEQLLRDIQFWMMDNDYDTLTPEGREIFDRISDVLGIDWNTPMENDSIQSEIT